MEIIESGTQTTVEQEIRSFIIRNFLFGVDEPQLTGNASFLQTGIIDSTGILELISFVEQKYEISIGDSEMLPENLDSLERIAAFVIRKRNGE